MAKKSLSNEEVQAYVSAYATRHGISKAEAERQILATGVSRKQTLHRFDEKKGKKEPKAPKAPKAKVAKAKAEKPAKVAKSTKPVKAKKVKEQKVEAKPTGKRRGRPPKVKEPVTNGASTLNTEDLVPGSRMFFEGEEA